MINMVNRNFAKTDVQLIVSQGHEGHRLMYVRVLVDAAVARGIAPVVVVMAGTTKSEEYAIHLSDRVDAFSVEEHVILNMSTISAIEARVAPTRATIFVEGDFWLKESLRSRAKLRNGGRLLIMRAVGQSKNPVVRVVQTLLKIALREAAKFRGVRSFVLVGPTQQSHGAFEVPDPAFSQIDEVAASAVNDRLSSGRAGFRWAAVLGVIGERKNVPLILEALLLVRSKGIGLVLAGRDDGSQRDLAECIRRAEQEGVRVERFDGNLSDAVLDAIVAAAGCVVLAHSNEGPSGILAKALYAGTPIVAAGARSLRRDVKAIGAGASWCSLDRVQLSHAIESAMTGPKPAQRENQSALFANRLMGDI
ncbi:MAG: hypothetical protein J0H96_01505 [Microbacterium ginsengisoli]|nr:glycosyltransferase [Microbacterium ginsengisoli]MBN9207323.1 hypothetical protein [Microbacterium ginsengisoli]